MTIGVVMFDAAYPPPVTGGKEKQAHLLARFLKNEGVFVEALSFDFAGQSTGHYEGVRVIRYRRSVEGLIKLIIGLLRRRRHARILHIHTPSRIGILILFAGRILGYRVVFKLPNEGLLERRKGFARVLWIHSLRWAHRLVVLEDDTERKLSNAGVPKARIFRAVNGIECASGRNNTPKRRKPAAGFACRLRLLIASRLVPQKRVEDAVRAIAVGKRNGLDLELRVLGDGPARGSLEKLVKELEVDSAVIFEGHVQDVRARLKTADALLLCSECEGMPNIVLEAMSVGLPVIATPVGAVPEMLGGQGKQWTYRVSDICALVDRLAAAQKDRKAFAAYGSFLECRCKSAYSLSVVATAYKSLYDSL